MCTGSTGEEGARFQTALQGVPDKEQVTSNSHTGGGVSDLRTAGLYLQTQVTKLVTSISNTNTQ